MSIYDFIRKYDTLGNKPELYVNSSTRYQTLFGGVLSLMTLGLLTAATISFSIQLINYESSTIIYNLVPSSNETLNLTGVPWMIMLQDNLFKPIEDEDRYYMPSANIWSVIPDLSTGELNMNTTVATLNIERCDINKHFGIYRPYFENVPFLEHHYCPVFDSNITISGVFGSVKPYKYVELWINRCRNVTRVDKRNKCYDEQSINDRLSDGYISYKFLDNAIDHQNLENPASYYLRADSLPVSSTIYKRNWYYLKNVNYTSDAGLIMKSNNLTQVFQVSSSKESVDLKKEGIEPGSFAQITLSMDNKVDVYFRTYEKVQNMLANIGGIIKGIIVIATAINWFVCQEMYFIDLMKDVFPEFKNNSNHLQKFNSRKSFIKERDGILNFENKDAILQSSIIKK
jgi:hypothetical protein